jgi:hypothetical protein
VTEFGDDPAGHAARRARRTADRAPSSAGSTGPHLRFRADDDAPPDDFGGIADNGEPDPRRLPMPPEGCVCRAEHSPEPLDGDWHHVWPLGMGGPNVRANLVWLCPTAHRNVHEILTLIVARNGEFSWGDAGDHYAVPVHRYAFTLAHEGYRRFTTGRLEP